MSRYYQRFTVKTSTTFPLDMLRYDTCFPDTEQDAGKIYYNLVDHRYPLEVKIARWIWQKADRPTIARWESFGCKVSNVEIR
jgi:hypothetical protein